MKASLVIKAGEGKGKVYEITDQGCTIGRVRDSDLRLRDTRVSRRHCIIQRDPAKGQFFVEEPEPTHNGTSVNGCRISEKTRLRSGDELEIGETVLLFLIGEDATQEYSGDQAVMTTISVRIDSGAPYAQKEEITRRALVESDEADDAPALDRMIGQSPLLQEAKEHIRRVAPTDARVLLLGETGTGKELAAKAIHEGSPRCDKTMACINVGALSDQLLQSELFGHKKGAFTGADEDRPGWFELADGGTLFLDEIGNLSERCQESLLRVIEDLQVVRLGDTKPIKVDVRIVAATDANLADSVAQGEFSRQLYYRLNVYPITLPPLRERADDILVLAEHFFERCNAQYRRDMQGLSAEARSLLTGYGWPGNVRELQHCLERAVIAARSTEIQPQDLPSEVQTFTPIATPSDGVQPLSLQDGQRNQILAALERTGWNKSKAAEVLGIARQTLHQKMKRLGIGRDS